VAPGDEASTRLAVESKALFQLIQADEVQATVTEVVVHEVCYVLGSKKHYALPGSAIQPLVAPIFELSGLKVAPVERRIYLRALEIFANDNKLGSADTLILARCEIQGLQLATQGRRMSRFPTVSTWTSG
jgi:predicted nucleic acid-binding protein